ncbi:MAG TPA: anhydro-N-acetylmuramic acid kinase, partial [Ignavibacteria bacterium]|nr:anhydro-N-acetylmuramic acid kinase [Ignavibacteria bacterium]
MNKKLINLLRKNKRTVIGLLSGTSVDAIDAVLLQVSGSGAATKVKVKDFIEYQVPQKIRLEIFKNSDKNTARIDDISRLNVIMGALFADAVLKILARNKISG